MSQTFERVVHVKVGKEEEVFSVHASFMTDHMFYFARGLESGPAVMTWSLPTVTPRSFHLLLDYVHGGPLKLSWTNVKDRPDLVDAWVLGDMVGATRFTNLIIDEIATNATRPGQLKLLPDNVCINHAYSPNVTDKDAPIRNLFVDLYIHFGTPDLMNELLAGPHNLRDFWFHYCKHARLKEEQDENARKDSTTGLRIFNPREYSVFHPHYATPPPIPVTRAGTKAYLCHYDGVNTITIEDGGQPMFIHRELSELRRDILMKCPPREFTFPAGWRPAATIFLRWLYYGRVTQEANHLKDFIRAYALGLTFHNPQFRDDVLTGLVSYCTRNQILPSASEVALSYTCTTSCAGAEGTHSPLRHFMVCWTLTHRHHAGVSINPSALPMDPALRETLERDMNTEWAAREASMNDDLAATSSTGVDMHSRGFPQQHPRPYADERFAGDLALGGTVAGAAPYYGDDVCRFHAAHPYSGYSPPLANKDREINGGIDLEFGGDAALGGSVGDGVKHDRIAALLGYSTKMSSSSSSSSASGSRPDMTTSMKSTAATGWTNPADDSSGAENPCHALLRKRNCYGAVVVGYRPKPIFDNGEPSSFGADSSSSGAAAGASQDKGKGRAAVVDDPPSPSPEGKYAKDPEVLAMLSEVQDRLNRVAINTTTSTNTAAAPSARPRLPALPPRRPPALNTGTSASQQQQQTSSGRGTGATTTSFASAASSNTPYTSPTTPRLTAGFPQPQVVSNVPGGDAHPANDIAAFNALRLPPGWQQRRCRDGRAYWARFAPDQIKRIEEATWVDPRAGVAWRRSDEASFVPGLGWGFEEGTETEVDSDEGEGQSTGGGGAMDDVQLNYDDDSADFDLEKVAREVEDMVEGE
ncbi:putative conserved hypothetical protein [Diplodia seriata]|uniref:BTB domain-containing protein n=1 Tax=Diplodia seriata TaxID=420778 RepID=A0A0G2E671_9PEZI|nr:putative conserved hypothetical protein [Diplodia seriata]